MRWKFCILCISFYMKIDKKIFSLLLRCTLLYLRSKYKTFLALETKMLSLVGPLQYDSYMCISVCLWLNSKLCIFTIIGIWCVRVAYIKKYLMKRKIVTICELSSFFTCLVPKNDMFAVWNNKLINLLIYLFR